MMDPTACWKRFLEALEANDSEETHNALDDLGEWLWRGGGPPDGMTVRQARMLVAICQRGAHTRLDC